MLEPGQGLRLLLSPACCRAPGLPVQSPHRGKELVAPDRETLAALAGRHLGPVVIITLNLRPWSFIRPLAADHVHFQFLPLQCRKKLNPVPIGSVTLAKAARPWLKRCPFGGARASLASISNPFVECYLF